jgi:hypothetical protein
MSEASVGQSFGFASGLPPGPEPALLPMNHRESLIAASGDTGGRGDSPGLKRIKI